MFRPCVGKGEEFLELVYAVRLVWDNLLENKREEQKTSGVGEKMEISARMMRLIVKRMRSKHDDAFQVVGMVGGRS